MRGAVARYAIAGLVALAVVAVAGALVLDRVSEDEAVEEARRLATLAGRGVVEPALTDDALAGRPAALDALDVVVQERVLSDDVVRVKVWTRDGRIAYSDEPRLIGQRYQLGADEQEAFESGDTEAEVADLSKPENRFERDEGSLLEVYLPIRTPQGEPALFELYRRESAVAASGRDLLVAIAPVLVGGLLLLWLIQLPLAWRGARRLEAGARERERLLEAALESSAVERRRVAADLHDGPVQSLAGLSYGLAAAAQRAPDGTDPATVDALRDGAEAAREGIRRLRAAVVEINPGRLHDEGLAAALGDLAAPLRARGVDVRVDVPADLALPEGAEQLLYRAAGEALRNVADHAEAAHVGVRVARDGGRADVRSAPGEGTVVELEVPV